MKMSIVKKSLENLLSVTTDESERIEIQKSINELNEQSERYFCTDIWNEELFVVTPNVVSDMLEYVTYDEFGKLMKSSGTVTKEQYFDLVRNQIHVVDFSDMTNSCLELGFDIVYSSWNENEEYGNNNEDGTFNPDCDN